MNTSRLSVASVALGIGVVALVLVLQLQIASTASGSAVDPGVRGGAADAGTAFAELTPSERVYFNVGQEDFEEAEDVPMDSGRG